METSSCLYIKKLHTWSVWGRCYTMPIVLDYMYMVQSFHCTHFLHGRFKFLVIKFYQCNSWNILWIWLNK